MPSTPGCATIESDSSVRQGAPGRERFVQFPPTADGFPAEAIPLATGGCGEVEPKFMEVLSEATGSARMAPAEGARNSAAIATAVTARRAFAPRFTSLPRSEAGKTIRAQPDARRSGRDGAAAERFTMDPLTLSHGRC